MNRSFQQYFNDQTDAYQSESLELDINKTHHGNVKIPTAMSLTKWTADFAETKHAIDIAFSFDLCGLVPLAEFNIENLHGPLKDVYNHKISVDTWIAKHSSILNNETVPLARCQKFTVYCQENTLFSKHSTQ